MKGTPVYRIINAVDGYCLLQHQSPDADPSHSQRGSAASARSLVASLMVLFTGVHTEYRHVCTLRLYSTFTLSQSLVTHRTAHANHSHTYLSYTLPANTMKDMRTCSPHTTQFSCTLDPSSTGYSYLYYTHTVRLLSL